MLGLGEHGMVRPVQILSEGESDVLVTNHVRFEYDRVDLFKDDNICSTERDIVKR